MLMNVQVKKYYAHNAVLTHQGPSDVVVKWATELAWMDAHVMVKYILHSNFVHTNCNV